MDFKDETKIKFVEKINQCDVFSKEIKDQIIKEYNKFFTDKEKDLYVEYIYRILEAKENQQQVEESLKRR